VAGTISIGSGLDIAGQLPKRYSRGDELQAEGVFGLAR
jgi:hypothetical protein